MVLVREVLQCKPGKVKEMAAKFNGVSDIMEEMGMPRFKLYTDLAAEHFWTLVAQIEVESVDAFLEMEGKVMTNPKAGEVMLGYHDLLTHGRREVFRVHS